MINKENLEEIINYKIGKVCAYLYCEYLNIDNKKKLSDFIYEFYNSKTSEILHQEDSKLWQESWVYILEMYNLYN